MTQDEQTEGYELYEVEVLDGELVEAVDAPFPGQSPELGGERLPAWLPQPSVQTAVAVATGFVAGAATLALLRRHALSRAEQAVGARGGYARPGHVRTFVVHVRPLSSQSN